jgi:tRNA (cytidine32/uridine32-2'-O)-methyltransferase
VGHASIIVGGAATDRLLDSDGMELSRVDVVLVRPARPANVAAACRAMKNMGLRRLCLVDPPPGLEEPAARALAYGAWDVLDGARRAGGLIEAVSGSTLVAGTSGRDLEGACTPRELAAEVDERVGGGRLSLVFGPEASGLTTRELGLCHVRVHAPTDPSHPSLNLAQAVLLVAYELRLRTLAPGPAADLGTSRPRATAGTLEEAVQDLRGALLSIGYLDPAGPDHILGELRDLLARAAPTPREVVLLRGLARQVSWAGRVARENSPSHNSRG